MPTLRAPHPRLAAVAISIAAAIGTATAASGAPLDAAEKPETPAAIGADGAAVAMPARRASLAGPATGAAPANAAADPGAAASSHPVFPPAAPSAPSAPPRGALLSGPTLVPIDIVTSTVKRLEPAVMRRLLDYRAGLLDITGEPRCAIAVHSVRYRTVGGQGEATDAGAIVLSPSGGGPCAGPRPVLLYAHGTVLDKTFTMARLNGEARLIAAMFAAQGYIVVAPDYAGYGASSLSYHPYLNAEQQASDMVDALRAARAAYPALGVQASDRLFLTGYSQGGFVALAAQRAIERQHGDEFTVTAAAGLSGPYALSQMADAIFSGSPNTGVTSYLPLLTTSGQRAGAALYAAPEDVYEARYASGIETLLPNKARLNDLVSKGRLPKGALFARDSQPQAADASAFFADRNLVRTSYRNGYLQDMAEHPCGHDPADPLACAPAHNLRKWMRKNDLRSYVPAAPLMLCGGRSDPVVPFANAVSAHAYFTAHGAAPLLVDLEMDPTNPRPDDPDLAVKQAFARERAAMRAEAVRKGDDPDKAVSDRYHSRLAAQYCLMAARRFFEAIGR